MDKDINYLAGEELCTQKDDQGILRFSSRIWISPVAELKNKILQEVHNSKYSIHPGSTKMYRDLKENYWWPDMKRDLRNRLTNVTRVRELRRSTRDRVDYYSH